MLIIVTGLPGTGKTSLATALSRAIHAKHRNSDVLRHKMNYGGRYDRAAKRTVYRRLLAEVEELIAARNNVVVDATFYKQHLREPFVEIAQRHNTPLIWIYLEADDQIVRKRLEAPRSDSEANFTVYEMLKKQYEPLPYPVLILRSDQMNTKELVKQAQAHIAHVEAELNTS